MKKYIIHSSWDVRIACGLAIELINKNITNEFSGKIKFEHFTILYEIVSFSIIDLFNPNARYGLKLNTFNLNQVIENSTILYLGARKIEEIGDYGRLICEICLLDELFSFQMAMYLYRKNSFVKNLILVYKNV